ncbi:MAG TPA: EamA family transporter [Gemmatimonadales bacterium]|jgi:drug/metabolite transporter (DMT)-like permease|nr:EamA family transporter [Gemmatimonadales bacterium]
MSTPARWLTPAVFLLLGLIWGSSFLWIKIALQEIGPATLVALRMSLGAIGFMLFLPFIGERLPRRWRELLPLAVLGLINTGLPIFLISWGELHVDSGTAAVLNSLVPLFSLIIAGLWLRTEPVTALRVTGLILGFGGAAVLASRELALDADPMGVIGALAVVGAAASYAFGASYARHRITRTHRYVVAGGSLVFAALYLWLLAIVSEWPLTMPTQPDGIIAVLWLGLLGSFVAYLCFFFLIHHLGATLATMVTYLFPVVGVGLGTIFLGELLDIRMIIGTALVLAGIVVVGLRYDAKVSREPGGALE